MNLSHFLSRYVLLAKTTDAKISRSEVENALRQIAQPIARQGKQVSIGENELISFADKVACSWSKTVLLGFSATSCIDQRSLTAFTWPSLYDICHKMTTKPVNTRAATATRAGCVWHGVGHKTFFPGATAEMLPKTHDPAYSSWALRGSLQTRSPSLSSYPIRTRLSSSSH